MDILDLDPKTFPKDDFGPPLGGMSMEHYEKWVAEMLQPIRSELERSPPPQPSGDPFVWK